MKISGLEVIPPEDISGYMSLMACAFDCGPLPIINGRLWSDQWRDAHYRNVRVEAVLNAETGVTRWAIREGSMALTKGGIWTWDRRKGGKALDRIRFDSAKEAVEHYFKWKEKVIKWAQRKLAKDPQAILNYQRVR